MPQSGTSQIFERATQLHQSGQLQEAERLYRQLLALEPARADVLQRLGILAHQSGRGQEAIELLQRAVALSPDAADCQINLGAVLAGQKRFEQAIVPLRRAIELRPDLAQAHYNLGNALMQLGRVDEAMAALQQATSLAPAHADAWFNLGNALHSNGDSDQAIAAYQRAIALRPNWPEAHNNLGSIYHERQDPEQAMRCYRQAAALAPQLPQIRSNLSAVLLEMGQLKEAVAEADRAVALSRDDAHSHFYLANALRQSGDPRAAIESYDRAIALRPEFDEAHANRGSALKDTGQLDAAIEAYRRAIALNPQFGQAWASLAGALRDAGELDESIQSYRKAEELTGTPWIGGNLLYALHFHPDYDARRIFEEHVRWNQRYARPLAAAIRPHLNDRSPERRLRIGYVSCDLRHHAVGRFMLPLLANHDRGQFEIYCYSDTLRPDAMTDQLRSHASQWRNMLGISDPRFAEQVRQDRIDILVDLSMHARTGRMMAFAQKPAPVQVSYLAYCSTSGLDTMDYRLSDPFLDPPGGDESVYFERTIRLPRTYWCYAEPQIAPPVGPLPALAVGSVTFGCLNTYAKVTEPTLHVWAQILREVPQSRLIVHSLEGRHREKARDLLAREGLDRDRLQFVSYMTGSRYFEQYNQIDIALDPFPYAGGTTTCDALWMGVPVVSLTGKTAVSRGGLSILSNLGMPELVTADPNRYAQIAVELAGDLPRLAEIRGSLRQRVSRSPLMDAAQFARDIETAYRLIWENWCNAK
ncbi:MAG TPA: tetratricopeptide repeat protein [Tepidisphaeraceae bacterium]|nr:tetratricopeptide repeat protein [Tepidisphaeraceae bacterium]